MGISPIWGFQLVTAITLSIIFRLNKALVVIASHISIPPMWPVIIYASYWTGGLLLGTGSQSMSFSSNITLESIWDNIFQYAIGAIVLAIVSGVIFGVMTYGMLRILKRPVSSTRSSRQNKK
jgi:uncharacterized protein (DUF2062 family)